MELTATELRGAFWTASTHQSGISNSSPWRTACSSLAVGVCLHSAVLDSLIDLYEISHMHTIRLYENDSLFAIDNDQKEAVG